MPRILLTTSTLPRWPSDPEARFVLDLARHLPPAWTPTLLAPAAPGAALHETMDGIEVIRYRYAPSRRWETLCYPGSTLARVQQNRRLWGLIPGLLAGLHHAVSTQLRTGRFDCVHAHWLFPQGLVHTLGFNQRRHPPLVVTSHGGDLGLALRWPVLQRMLRPVLRRADVVTVVAPGMRDALVACDPEFSRRSIPVITMGADTSWFGPQLRDPEWLHVRGLSPPVVLSVGRLVEKKGLDTLLEGFATAPLAQTSATLAICGDGPLAGPLRERATALGIGDRTRFLGSLDHNELRIAYASSDIFCLPSVTTKSGDLDGMPTVLAEAAASGLPLVGSRLAGIPLIVEPERTGILVESGDAAALSHALAELVEDEDLRRRFGEGALIKAKEFSWPKIAEAFVSVYAEASARHALSNAGS